VITVLNRLIVGVQSTFGPSKGSAQAASEDEVASSPQDKPSSRFIGARSHNARRAWSAALDRSTMRGVTAMSERRAAASRRTSPPSGSGV